MQIFQVLDYLDVVKHPMDLSTMRQKAETHQYRTIDQFASDFELMIDNCLTYNAKETIFYRTAVKLRDQVSGVYTKFLLCRFFHENSLILGGIFFGCNCFFYVGRNKFKQ